MLKDATNTYDSYASIGTLQKSMTLDEEGKGVMRFTGKSLKGRGDRDNVIAMSSSSIQMIL